MKEDEEMQLQIIFSFKSFATFSTSSASASRSFSAKEGKNERSSPNLKELTKDCLELKQKSRQNLQLEISLPARNVVKVLLQKET